MRLTNKLYLCLLAPALFVQLSSAQPKKEIVEVRVKPCHAEWQAKIGEKIRFEISVLKDGIELKDAALSYCVGKEMMLGKTTEVAFRGQTIRVDAGSLNEPGFVSCVATAQYQGKSYRGIAKVGVEPLKIVATTVMPDDFDTFWEGQKTKLASLPLAAKITPLPEREGDNYKVYHVSFQNERPGSRIYGILSVPKGCGTFPAILNVPGAGIRAYEGDSYLCNDGYISLTIGIHGFPVNLDKEVYESLFKAGLDRYWLQWLNDRDAYYYKRVYLGLVRAIDFIYSLPEFDKRSLAVSGGSQGGALAIVAAALDSRVSCYTSFYPALCDLTGYLHNRAAGWPAMFRHQKLTDYGVAQQAKVSQYYDVVNFARRLKVPGFLSWGYNDEICPPTSVYAAYNAIEAPKESLLSYDSGHWNYPEQWEMKQKFIKSVITKK